MSTISRKLFSGLIGRDLVKRAGEASGLSEDELYAKALRSAAADDVLAALRLALTVMDASDPDTMDVIEICVAAIQKAEGRE